MVLSIPVINPNKKSKKGYKYSKDVINDALEDPALKARIDAGSLWCEVTETDQNEDNKKFSIYDLDVNHVCGTIIKLYWKDEKLFADISINNYGYGKELIEKINNKSKIKFLLKGNVTLSKINKNYVDYLEIVTFAWYKKGD